MNTKLKAGEQTYMNITDAHGVLMFVVLVQLFTDHVSLTFPRHNILDRAMPIAEGRAYLRFLIDEAAAGTPAWLIEQRAGEWSSAMAAADDHETELIASLQADFDARQADLRAEYAQEQAAIARIMAGPDEFQAARRAARNRIDPAVFQPTKGNVHCKPLTPAMRNLAAQHRDGIVRLPAGVDWRLLRGIVRRGHGTVHEAERYRITAVRLNERGLAAANQASKEIAA